MVDVRGRATIFVVAFCCTIYFVTLQLWQTNETLVVQQCNMSCPNALPQAKGNVVSGHTTSKGDHQGSELFNAFVDPRNRFHRLVQSLENHQRSRSPGCLSRAAWFSDGRKGDQQLLCINSHVLASTPEMVRWKEPFETIVLSEAQPFVTGTGFRRICDVVCDTNKHGGHSGCHLDPRHVLNRSLVYVDTKDLPILKEALSRLRVHIFLLTHGRDLPINAQYSALLRSRWVLKWFALNKEMLHPKLIPIPLGLKPSKVPTILQFHQRAEVTAIQPTQMLLYKVRQFGRDWCDRWWPNTPLKRNCYIYADRRMAAHRAMLSSGFKFGRFSAATNTTHMDLPDFYRDTLRYRFVLSPSGQGWDTYRTWETLALGRFVVLLRSPLDPLFADLPVVLVDRWEEVTPVLLEDRWRKMAEAKYERDQLLVHWWERFILRECLAVP
eukprot:GGOE01044035.1.p1 GENE.GGOE01044035.1~~GGOE01044035.1.p1  ORF type:complete len:439 (+),score=98.20 GGOE01044035.1:44-1360(+)